MTDDDIKASMALAAKWSKDELDAYVNSSKESQGKVDDLLDYYQIACYFRISVHTARSAANSRCFIHDGCKVSLKEFKARC
jgi:hypothetical protein